MGINIKNTNVVVLQSGEAGNVAQATPTISVSNGGLITATATQSEGYVSAGVKKATRQLDTQAAQAITPSTTDQVIEAGVFLTGAQTIKGDSNLIAANIRKGVTIFGIAGTYEASGGGDNGDEGGSGGDNDNGYNGETTVSESESIVCNANANFGASSLDYKDLIITRSGSTDTDGVVSRVQDGKAYYYDEYLGEETYTSVRVVSSGGAFVTGLEVSVSETTENGTAVCFDGTYSWSFIVE